MSNDKPEEADQPHPTDVSGWRPGFYSRPVDAVVKHQMRLALGGVEHTAITGPRGAGKTALVQHIIDQYEKQLTSRLVEDPDADLKAIHYYESSTATGNKTALTNMFERISSHRSRTIHTKSADHVRDRIGRQLVRKNIGVICIDEAHKIDEHNLDQVRQVADYVSSEFQQDVGLVLIGEPKLWSRLLGIGQAGQRFATHVEVEPISARGEVEDFLVESHPDTSTLRRKLDETRWSDLVGRFRRVTRGNLRRMTTVLLNANEFARISDAERVTAQHLMDALEKLADEV